MTHFASCGQSARVRNSCRIWIQVISLISFQRRQCNYPDFCIFVPRKNEDLFKEKWNCKCAEWTVHEAAGGKVVRPHKMLQNQGQQINGNVKEASHYYCGVGSVSSLSGAAEPATCVMELFNWILLHMVAAHLPGWYLPWPNIARTILLPPSFRMQNTRNWTMEQKRWWSIVAEVTLSSQQPVTGQQRLGNESMRRFDACALCLNRAREPLACNEGHLFCKECVYTDLRESIT